VNYASLIFHDENGSEYRALDQDNPVTPDDSIRTQIAHGELTPPSDRGVHGEGPRFCRGAIFPVIG
jgi:hypothetical protein